MKKLILSVGLLSLSLSVFSQTSGMGGSASSIDSSTNPSGIGFGGAMGGATSNNMPSNVGAGNMGTPQQMQDNSFTGGSYGGNSVPQTTSPAPASNLPGAGGANTTTPPTQPNNIPSATGVGTGAPTSF